MSAPILRPFPELRDEADRRERELVKALGRDPWDESFERAGERAIFRQAILALLSDLTRPASRDAVARLVAAKVGLEVGATAPSFERGPRLRPDGPALWMLTNGGRVHWFGGHVAAPVSSLGGGPGVSRVPGIDTIADPAEALAAICAAIFVTP